MMRSHWRGILMMCFGCVGAGAAPVLGQAADKPAIEALLQALQQQNYAVLEPWVGSEFHIGPVQGEQARAALRNLVHSGARVPKEIVVDSVTRSADGAEVFVTLVEESAQRAARMRLDADGRFADVGLMRVTSTAQQTVPIQGNAGAAGNVLLREVGGGSNAVQNPQYRSQLLQLHQRDQRHRAELNDTALSAPRRQELWAEQERLDRENLARLRELLTTHGWPRRNDVGEDAAIAAFLVIQHAPLEVQKELLPVLREQAAAGELSAGALAMLEDRVEVREGRPQIYGTQVRRNPGTGALEPYPIRNPDAVDTLRAGVGLPPLAEYLRLMSGGDQI